MRVLYREHRFECGQYLEVEHYPVFEVRRRGRAPKRKPSTKTQKRHNEIAAKRKIIRLAHANFTPDDIRFDLTYNEGNYPESAEAAQKQMQNFLRRLRRFRRKHDLPELKYIAVTEIGKTSKRFHHHILLNCGDMKPRDLAELWNRGYTKIASLQFNDTGIVDLAKYMVKNPILGKRWLASRNIQPPKETVRDGRISAKKIREYAISSQDNRAELEKLYKGYHLSEITPYFNDVNGSFYVSIFMRKDERRKR